MRLQRFGPLLALGLVASAVGVGVSSPALTVGGPLGALIGWHWRRQVDRDRRLVASRSEVIDLVDRLIQRLKVGGSLRSTLRHTGGDRFLVSATTLAAPSAAKPVFMATATRADSPAAGPADSTRVDERLLSSTVAVLVERGGPALPSLERLSDTLRSAHALEAESRLQAGQATASVAALVALPSLFIAVLVAVDQRLRRFYLFETGGAVCLLSAVALSYTCWWLMQRLIKANQ